MRFLNSYENSKAALYLYKNCKELLYYDTDMQALKLNKNLKIEQNLKKESSLDLIWGCGIFLNFLFILYILFDSSIENYSGDISSLLVIIFLIVLLISFLIFKISRNCQKMKDVEKLFNLSRIEMD